MTRLDYEVVEHDGAWAYRVDGVFSKAFATHDLARAAADGAALRQGLGGEDDAISYEDAKGRWHDEVARGDDRPEMEVEGRSTGPMSHVGMMPIWLIVAESSLTASGQVP